MNRVLLHLAWVESRALGRIVWRRLPTRGGIVAAVAAFVLVVGVPYAAYLSVARQGNFGATLEFMHTWMNEAFFVFVMMGAVAPRGLYYRPAELALLFPAPLPRRQLVLYNIVWRARMSVLSALWLAFIAAMGGRPIAVSILGYTLMLLLLQTSSQWFAVLRARLSAQPALAQALRWTAAVAIGVVWVRGETASVLHFLSWATRPALETVSAATLMDALPWAGVAAATIAGLVGSTCLMDSVYHEAALARSFERKRRKRTRGGSGAYGPGAWANRFRLPSFPYLGGAGPVAWRQSVELLRNPRRIVLVFFVVACSALGAVALVQLEAGSDFQVMTKQMRAWVVIFVLCVAPLLSGDSLGYDFRRDLDRMATLKSLPISPVLLAVGQLAPATLFVTTVQILGVAAVAAASDAVSYVTVIAMLVVMAPVNWSAIAAENALFLLAPYRTVSDDPGDMTFAGRLALATALKMASLITFGLLAVVTSLVMIQLTRGSLPWMLTALGSVLAAACIPVTMFTGWAFRRFDVGRDVPA